MGAKWEVTINTLVCRGQGEVLKRSLRNEENRAVRAMPEGEISLLVRRLCAQKVFKQKLIGIFLGPKQKRHS